MGTYRAVYPKPLWLKRFLSDDGHSKGRLDGICVIDDSGAQIRQSYKAEIADIRT